MPPFIKSDSLKDAVDYISLCVGGSLQLGK